MTAKLVEQYARDSLSDKSFRYQTGFGNELESEAIAGALPMGQNSPQRPPLGLVSELISGTTFSAPRSLNRRTYVFRKRPSAMHGPFEPIDARRFLSPPLAFPPSPNQLRWDPFVIPEEKQDFVEGLTTICGNGSPSMQMGMSIHTYLINHPMGRRFFANADGEMLIIPDTGGLFIATELGRLRIDPGEIALIPRGIKFQIDPVDRIARGFVCENYGLPFRLPELGLIGSNGLANAADFQIPVAFFEADDRPSTIVAKMAGNLWAAELAHSALDVVAWRGTHLPCKFDMHKFVAMGTLTVDHPDPSIFCALTSPSDAVLGGNVDFMVLPPRWIVSEHSLRPPGFHRNCVAEFLGIVAGQHESKSHGFMSGGASLHNNWVAHGPDVATYDRALDEPLVPRKIEDSLVFMIESRMPLQLTSFALESPELQADYAQSWQGFSCRFMNPVQS